MKHDELQNDLAKHLRGGTDRMVWQNTQLGPSGSPRPDVFTVNKSFARFRSDAYEIKVSVSDLRHDVTSGKWQSYRKFAHCVWFAFPRGMAPLDLIPRECGVILRSDAGWRAARKPVAQVLDSLPRDAWLKLLIESFPEWPAATAPRSMNEYLAAEIVRKKIGADLGTLFADVANAEARLKWKKEGLDKQIADVEKQVSDRRALMEADARRTAERLSSAMVELAETLGLKQDATPSELCAAIHQLRGRLGQRGIEQAITLLEGLRGTLKEPETVA
jgi:hypothetical protein